MLGNDEVVIQLIIVIGTIATTYLTVKYKDRVMHKTTDPKPKDRMDTIFDGYEKLIKQQQLDNERKQIQLEETQRLVNELQEQLRVHRQELIESRRHNQELIDQLAAMKKQYEGQRKTMSDRVQGK